MYEEALSIQNIKVGIKEIPSWMLSMYVSYLGQFLFRMCRFFFFKQEDSLCYGEKKIP